MSVFGKKTSESKVGKAPAETRWNAGKRVIPVVSEKAERLRKQNQYMFAARGTMSKVELKKAIEGTYGVRVESITSTNLPRKTVRRGRTNGTTRVRHRFIVRVKSGETIDVTKSI